MYRPYHYDFLCNDTDTVVSTPKGKLKGYRTDGIYEFKGIRYATAKRFMMPEPIPAWEGIVPALKYGPGCMDTSGTAHDYDELIQPGRNWGQSEDCQNLNIWTKSIDKAAKRPVYVWLHGGGYSGGSATHMYAYDGFELTQKYDTVIVSVNHRLNMWGFMDFSAYGEEYRHSANVGMADIVAALEWIHENIACFGGDPDNVTIAGQSGGGGKVITLMQMPSADGLYKHAIVQSGVFNFPDLAGKYKKLADRTVELLGLTEGHYGELSTLPYETVRAAIKQGISEIDEKLGGAWMPTAEPGYYEGDPRTFGFRRETADIPMLIGNDTYEFSDFIAAGDKSKFTEEQRMEILTRYYGDRAKEVEAAWNIAYPDLDASYAASADMMFRPNTKEFVELRSKTCPGAIYTYMFNFESLLDGGQLTFHSSEINFVFHNALYMDAFIRPGVTDRLQDAVSGAWMSFTASGNPNFEGLPQWTAYTAENGACMMLGNNIVERYHHDDEYYRVLKDIKGSLKVDAE